MPQLPATTVVTPWLIFGRDVRRVDDDAVVMGVGIDEARRKRSSAEVVLGLGGALGHGPGRPDKRDALAGNGEFAMDGRVPRAVVEQRIPEHMTVAGSVGWRGHSLASRPFINGVGSMVGVAIATPTRVSA